MEKGVFSHLCSDFFFDNNNRKYIGESKKFTMYGQSNPKELNQSMDQLGFALT
jgi:hypothetical protein